MFLSGINMGVKHGKGLSDEILCVQFSFCFLRLQFYFSNYVIVSCKLPYYNSFGQRMLLKN